MIEDPRGTRRPAFFAACASVAACAFVFADPPPAQNLIRNGDFETADGDHPAGWNQVESEADITTSKKEFLNGAPRRIWLDGLTCFWVDDPLGVQGKCLKEDTDVNLDEFQARRKEMEQDRPPPAKPKTPTKGAKYDTVGGNDGVHFYSDFVAVKPRMRYALSVDYLPGEHAGAPKLWIKAYKELEGWKRVAYKKSIDLKGGTARNWRTFTMTFNPTRLDPRGEIRWMRVDLYAYWPAGTYYFDNVKLVEAGEEAPPAPKNASDDDDD